LAIIAGGRIGSEATSGKMRMLDVRARRSPISAKVSRNRR